MTIPVDIPVHAALSRDGARILTASRDGAARLFERATGKKLGEFPGERDTLRSAEFAADEAEILLTYGDGRLVFIDAANGKQLRTSQGAPLERSDPVTQMAGDVQLVLQDGEGPSQFEVVFRGQSLGVLLAPSRIVRPILSPDGVYVFGAAIDRQAIYVFDGHRNEFIATLPLEHNANGVYVSADGRWLLATWLDRVTAIAFPAIDELIAQVRAQLSRGLTDAERRTAHELRESVKAKVKQAGLWAPHLPPEYGGAGLGRGGHVQGGEQDVVALVDVVHQAGDLEPAGHGIAQRAGREPLGELPLHVHRQAGVAGVLPVTVPARRGQHADRQLDLAAGRRGPFRDQLGFDPARLGQRRREQQGEKDQQPSKHRGSASA